MPMDRTEKAFRVTELIVLAGSAVWVGISTHYVGQQVSEMRIAQNFAVDMEKRKKALEFIQRFNSREVHSTLEEAAKVMEAASKGRDVDWHPVQPLLNFYEEMSMSVKEGLAEEDIVKRFFKNIILFTYKRSQPFIESGQGYPYLKAIYSDWSKNQLPPPVKSLDRKQ